MVRKDFEKIFNKLDKIEPPADLVDKILTRIALAKKRQTLCRVTLGLALSVASGIAIFASLINIGQVLNTSGFFQYLSLVQSDSGLLLVLWKDFSLSLAETLPVLSLTLLMTTVWIFLQSLRLTVSLIYGHNISARAQL